MAGGMPMPQGGQQMPQGPQNNGQGGMPMPQGMQNMNGGGMPNNGGMGVNPMMPGVAPVGPAMAAPVQSKKSGAAEIAILVVVCIIAAIGIITSVYFFTQWNTLNQDFESKLAVERANAVAEQIELDRKNYEEQEKNPFASFLGPEDYGSVYFEYPKLWNSYVESDGENGKDFEAYFFPTTVPPIKEKESRYSLRVTILNKSADRVMDTYNNLVKKGTVTATPYSANDGKISGTIYSGAIEKDMNGKVFIAKINDKTLIMQTDSIDAYGADFDVVLSKLRRD